MDHVRQVIPVVIDQKKAKTFLADVDRVRIQLLNNFNKIFEGELYSEDRAETVFKLKEYFQNSQRKLEILSIAVNLGSLISTLNADFLFGNELKITYPDSGIEEKLRDFQMRTGFDMKLYESALLHSAVGYTAFVISVVDDLAVVNEIPYNNYIPEWDPTSLSDKPFIVTIPRFFDQKVANNGKDQHFVLKIIHSVELLITNQNGDTITTENRAEQDGELTTTKVGKITREVWQINKLTLKEETKRILKEFFPNMEEETLTELDYIPVEQINNIKTVKRRFGTSDYKKVLGLLEEVNDRTTQISLQFIKHLKAKMAVPKGAVKVNEEDGQPVAANEDMELFFMDPGEEAPKYIEYSNSLIEEAFKHIEKIIVYISKITQNPFIVPDEKGGVEKVESIKARLAAFEKKIKRNQKAYTRGIIGMLRAVADFEGFDFDIKKVKLEFSAGLPFDELVRARTMEIAINKGFMSKRRATQLHNKLEGDDLEGELANIKDEEGDVQLSFD